MTANERISRDIFKGWVVVVVEDDPASRDIVSTVLERYGATVHAANNGVMGIEAIRQHKPHFVITDLDMPALSGWDMVAQIREIPEVAHTPVIALSAQFVYPEKARAQRKDILHYISKPVTPSRFIRELVDKLIKPDESGS